LQANGAQAAVAFKPVSLQTNREGAKTAKVLFVRTACGGANAQVDRASPGNSGVIGHFLFAIFYLRQLTFERNQIEIASS
jgi:hypothetical protein